MITFTITFDTGKAEKHGFTVAELDEMVSQYFKNKATVRKIGDHEWEDDTRYAVDSFAGFMNRIKEQNDIYNSISEMYWIVDGRPENCLEIIEKWKKVQV